MTCVRQAAEGAAAATAGYVTLPTWLLNGAADTQEEYDMLMEMVAAAEATADGTAAALSSENEENALLAMVFAVEAGGAAHTHRLRRARSVGGRAGRGIPQCRGGHASC